MAILKKIRSGVDKVRKKYIPTFGEQFDKAKKEGKKTFTSMTGTVLNNMQKKGEFIRYVASLIENQT